MHTRTLVLAAVLCSCGSVADDGRDAGGGADAGTREDAGSGDAGREAACPLDPVARTVLEEIVAEGVLDAVFVALASGEPPDAHNAFAITLPGTGRGMVASYTPRSDCTAESFLEPTCIDEGGPTGDPFYDTRVACGRHGWDAECTELEQVWFSMLPQRTAEPRHAFTYPLELPPESPLADTEGEVRWSANPLVELRRTLPEEGGLVVHADLDHAFTVVLADRTLDFGYQGYIEAVVRGGEAEQAVFAGTFSALAAPHVVSASAEITDEQGTVEGRISVGVEVLGTVGGTLPDTPTITWNGSCAD